jgi:hypothetical protein
MKASLLKVVLCKEKLHWHRVVEIYGKFDNVFASVIAGTIVAILFTVGHYCHVIMHVLFETFLYIFYRNMYKSNLMKLSATCDI